MPWYCCIIGVSASDIGGEPISATLHRKPPARGFAENFVLSRHSLAVPAR